MRLKSLLFISTAASSTLAASIPGSPRSASISVLSAAHSPAISGADSVQLLARDALDSRDSLLADDPPVLRRQKSPTPTQVPEPTPRPRPQPKSPLPDSPRKLPPTGPPKLPPAAPTRLPPPVPTRLPPTGPPKLPPAAPTRLPPPVPSRLPPTVATNLPPTVPTNLPPTVPPNLPPNGGGRPRGGPANRTPIPAEPPLTTIPIYSTSRNGPCTAPSTRVEWRQLTEAQRQEYITSVQCLKATPSKTKMTGAQSHYDDFVLNHVVILKDAHLSPIFLPYHRGLMSAYESALRETCNYRAPLPYWDWSVDYLHPDQSPVWSSNGGVGGNGNQTHDGCVNSGPFAVQPVTYPTPHCLRRNFLYSQLAGPLLGSFYAPLEISRILAFPTLDQFRKTLESLPHNNVHQGIGGDMAALSTSVNDPIFFLHHANVDRLWWTYQKSHPEWADRTEMEGDVETEMSYSSIIRRLKMNETFNTQGGADGYFCYTYSDSIQPASNLAQQPLSQHPPLTQAYLESMNYTPAQIADVRSLESDHARFIDEHNAQLTS